MTAPETYHHESIVNFHTIHSVLIIYPDGKKVFDSMLVSEGKTVSTPRSHKKELLKKAEEEKEAEEEAIREMNDDELLQAIDNPQTVMGLALEREVDRYRYSIVEDELKQRGLIRMTEEETKEEERDQPEAERREMSFEEVKDFFAENGHLPEPEDYDVKKFYENFDEYKNEVNRKQDTWTGADIAFFADFEEALEESYEIEKEIQED